MGKRLALNVLLCLFAATTLQAQAVFSVKEAEQAVFWQNIAGFKPPPTEKKGSTATFPTENRDSACARLLAHFHARSFLLASADTLLEGHWALHLGPAVRWVSLSSGNAADWLNIAGLRLQKFQERPLRHDEALHIKQSLLEAAENNGYPFASVWLDSLTWADSHSLSAAVMIDKGRFVRFKGFKVSGDLRLPEAYLPNYLGWRPGTAFSRQKMLRIREQLRSLPFVDPIANPSVTFSGHPFASEGEATVNLPLRKKRASRFDFIIGLLPQPDATDGRLLLTGSLSTAFQNALNLGERFSAEIERLRPETQKLEAQTGVPYLFGTLFGAEGKFGIFRRDSTWVDASGDVGISYLFSGGNTVRFLWENKSASLQKVDTASILLNRQLPAALDFSQNGFGLELNFARLDYRFNPRKGWSLLLKGTAGFNNLRRNSQIVGLRDPDNASFSFGALYDSIGTRAARYRLEGKAEWFVPMFVRSTVKMGLRGGGIFSSKPIWNNEQYRLGGHKLLRGFDEESLFASRFVVGTLEWRLLLGANSYLAAFADGAYIENITLRNRFFLRPLGLGAGLNFETQAGIFGISVAVGRRDVGQGIDWRATKFHLGYINLF